VCSRNRLRSPTAEAIFSDFENVSALSAGTNPDAETPISADLIEWADIIFAMEDAHGQRVRQRFGKLLRESRSRYIGRVQFYGPGSRGGSPQESDAVSACPRDKL
jgi:predicted protein tyrosine phosphatase